MHVKAGTSGFNFDGWRGVFYPPDLPTGAWLSFYAARLATVEINYSFYRVPSSATLQGWAQQVPDTFRFSLKASQRISHRTRLADRSSADYFCARVTELGASLGPVLVQLPPTLRKDVERLRTFLSWLPPGMRAAVEFRHKSWFEDPEVEAVLRQAGAALCIADEEGLEVPRWATAPFGYLRLRRQAYDAPMLADWAGWVRQQSWGDAFVYFKHEEAAQGVALADQFMGLVAG